MVPRRYVVVACLAAGSLAVITLGALWWTERDLNQVRQFVETRYAGEIAQIEATMRRITRSEREYASREAAVEALTPLFDPPEFFYVGWTEDTHHGADSIKRLPTGFKVSGTFWLLGRGRGSWPGDASQVQRELLYARSFDGERLFVYRVWLPDSPVLRDYRIVFYADQIRAGMNP